MKLAKKDTAERRNLTYDWDKSGTLKFSISGELSATTFALLWKQADFLLQRYNPRTLILDTKDITYCDSIGAVFILELKKHQENERRQFELKNFSSEFQKVLNFLAEQEKGGYPSEQAKLDPISRLGKAFVNAVLSLKENIAFLGAVATHLVYFFRHPRSMRWQDFWRALDDVGPRALPIIVLIGFLVGLISTFQSAEPMGRFGAQIYIIDLVGLGLVREMGPLMTAVLLAGRTASAFSAEIGSMKINQEIDALTTMGLDSVRFLTIPRILAGIIMTPILSMFLIISGLLGCFFVMLSLGYNPRIFLTELYSIVSMGDFLSGLAKTFVFGAVIVSIGCLHGLKTGISASAVGETTTQAVVSSLIMLVIVDGVFATVYYALGV